MSQHDDKEALRLQKEFARFEAIDNQDIDAFIAVALGDTRGQKFLWWLLQVGKYGVNPFSPDSNVMAFQSGEANVGAQILSRIIDVNPIGFAELQMQRKIEDDRRSSRAAELAAGDDLFATGDSDDS